MTSDRDCLVPKSLSLSMKMCQQRKAGRRQPSVPSPWSPAVHHQSLAFRARLCHVKIEAPKEKAVTESGWILLHRHLQPLLAFIYMYMYLNFHKRLTRM